MKRKRQLQKIAKEAKVRENEKPFVNCRFLLFKIFNVLGDFHKSHLKVWPRNTLKKHQRMQLIFVSFRLFSGPQK